MYAESMRDYAGMPMVELSEDEFVEIYRIRQLLEPEEGSLSRWDLACLQGLSGSSESTVCGWAGSFCRR